jgi:NhaP-type Na+/H+ and K+/H+ antiporter
VARSVIIPIKAQNMKAYLIDLFFKDIIIESKPAPNVSKVNLICNNDSVIEIISINMKEDFKCLKSSLNTIEMRHANKVKAIVSGKSCEERYIPTGAVRPKRNVAVNADLGLLKNLHIV